MVISFRRWPPRVGRARDPPRPSTDASARLVGEVLRMRKRFLVLPALFLIAMATLVAPNASAVSAKFDWHISDAFIQAGTGVTQTGALAQASNGDIARLSGSGTFNTASSTASGGGVFVHTTSGGTAVGFGTWKATGVEDFTFFGCGGGFPSNFCGGQLVLDVHISGVSLSLGPTEVDGVLTITCLIGGEVPPGAEEGITLDIPGVINFSDLIESGFTLFVSRSKA